jgi:hypothetical protein
LYWITDVESKALTNISNGLFKSLVHQDAINAANADADAEGNDNDDGARDRVHRGHAWNVDKGKEPMCSSLFDAVCGWMLKIGTKDMAFAHCYM